MFIYLWVLPSRISSTDVSRVLSEWWSATSPLCRKCICRSTHWLCLIWWWTHSRCWSALAFQPAWLFTIEYRLAGRHSMRFPHWSRWSYLRSDDAVYCFIWEFLLMIWLMWLILCCVLCFIWQVFSIILIFFRSQFIVWYWREIRWHLWFQVSEILSCIRQYLRENGCYSGLSFQWHWLHLVCGTFIRMRIRM